MKSIQCQLFKNRTKNSIFGMVEIFYFNFLIGKVTHFRTIGIAPQFLSELRVQFRDFCLASLDKWRCYRDVEATWDTRDVQRNKYFNWPEFWFLGPLNFKNPLYSKWFIQQSDTKKFLIKDLSQNL